MPKIRTNKKVYQSRSGEMCFVSREIVEFNNDKKNKIFYSIIKEEAFIESDEEILDSDGNGTGVFEFKKTIMEHIGTNGHDVSYSDVNNLFNTIGRDIVSDSNFIDEFEALQELALLIDTKKHNLYGSNSEDWIKEEANV